ncbi:MAG: ABC transporter ATP-binding protein [Rhodospirillaceae bacterium]|nr:ABC transporter ATP-binding protein [Rhodospirillaceae bacterium]
MSQSVATAPDLPRAASEAPLVRLRGVSKSYGSVTAVRPLDLDIHRGDFVAILGPSGCGKTTLLRIIGGFVAPTTGTVEIGGQDVTRLGPEKRPSNMVFQGYGLFPHMTVRQNIAYGLKIARRPRAEIDARVGEALALVHLEDMADRSINELSGGQQQRVALARALVMRPQVLLLDEPLAALDLKLRQAMQEELRRIHQEIGGTFVFVTHDQGEALALASRIAVMEAGVLVQVGDAEEIYARPKTRFVSTFIGEANVFEGVRRDGVVTFAGLRVAAAGRDGRVTVMVRPEDVRLALRELAADIALEGTVEDIIYLGAFVKYRVALPDGQRLTAVSTDRVLRLALAVGRPVQAGWSADDQRIIEE